MQIQKHDDNRKAHFDMMTMADCGYAGELPLFELTSLYTTVKRNALAYTYVVDIPATLVVGLPRGSNFWGVSSFGRGFQDCQILFAIGSICSPFMSVRQSGQRGSVSLYQNWYRGHWACAITTDFVYSINKAQQSGIKRSVKHSLDDVGKVKRQRQLRLPYM